MKTCLWLSGGAPDETLFRWRADRPSRNGSACRLEAPAAALHQGSQAPAEACPRNSEQL